MTAPGRAIAAARPGTATWLLAALLVFGCHREQPAAPAAGVSVIGTAGVVTRAGDGQAASPAVAGPLAVGDRLATAGDGTARLRLPDGREVELHPGTQLRVEAGGPGEIVLRLDSGSIVSRLAQPAAAPPITLRILTPFGVTRVPQGPGEAHLDVRGDGADIVVSIGEIAFSGPDGRSVRASAGDRLEISLGGIELIAASEAAAAAPVPTIVGRAIEMVLSSDTGPLLVRAPGARGFVRQRTVTAAPGTAYRVPGAEGRARLSAGDLRVRLTAGAEGRLGAAQHADETDRYQLGLTRGSALIQLPGGAPQEVRLPIGKEELALRASKRGSVKVVSGKQGLSVLGLLGDVELELGGRRRKLTAGERVQVSPGRLGAATRAPAVMTLPTARGLHVHADALDEVAVSWPADLADARIQVASDPEFKDILLEGESARDQVTVPAPRKGDLYWRISGLRQGSTTTLNGHARFRPDRGRSVLDLTNPHNLVAETGEVTTVYFQSVLPALTFSFFGRPEAQRYRLRIYRAGALDRPIVQREVSSTQCSLEAGALTEGSYLWHAVAVDAQGKQSGGGLMNKLELLYDNALNTLAIGSPKPGARARGAQIQVSGIAPMGSKLYVNGQPVPLDGKGRFDLRVQRSPAVVFRLVEHDGSQSYWVRAMGPRS